MAKKESVKKKIFKRMLYMLTGSALVAVALEKLLVPNNIIDGGVVGISIILSHLMGIKLGILLFILNLPFLVLGYKQIGKTFAFSTLFAIVIMSVGTTFFHHSKPFIEDPLLAAVFGGLGVGIGVGLVLRGGGSLDGTEICALVINKKIPFSVGEIVMFFNVFILGSAGFVFGLDRALYSLIAYYVAYKMIDVTVEGLDQTRSVWIISDNYKEIGDAIINRLGRGVTYLNGEGAFSGDSKQVVFCIINRLEEAKLKTVVDELDENAFLAVGHIHDVKGGRFKKKSIH